MNNTDSVKHALKFSEKDLVLIETSWTQAIIPITIGRLKLYVSENKNFGVQKLLQKYKGKKIAELRVRVYNGSIIESTHYYRNVNIIPVSYITESDTNKGIMYELDVVAETHTSDSVF